MANDPIPAKPCATSSAGADIELEGPGGIKARARNLRKLDYAITLILFGMGYMFWEHMQDSKQSMQMQVASARETAAAIRYFSCIISIDQDQRMAELQSAHGVCAKMGRP